MENKISSLLMCLLVTSYFSVSYADDKIGQITKYRGVLQLEGRGSLRMDSKGSKYFVITITNSTSKVLWIPRPSSEKPEDFNEKTIGLLSCESLNWYIETGTNRPISSHTDYGLCEFPRSYSKLLPNKSAVYLLNLEERNKDIKLNKFNVDIWAPWRLKNGQLINKNVKEVIVAKQVDTYETIIIREAIAHARKNIKKTAENTKEVKGEGNQIDKKKDNPVVPPALLIERIVAHGDFNDLKIEGVKKPSAPAVESQ